MKGEEDIVTLSGIEAEEREERAAEKPISRAAGEREERAAEKRTAGERAECANGEKAGERAGRHPEAEAYGVGRTIVYEGGNGGRYGGGSDGGANGSGGNGRKRRPRIGVLFGGDKVLWTIIITLLIFSMLLTFSATVYKPGGTPTSKLIGQLTFIAIGTGALLLVHLIRYQFYGRIASFVFWAGWILTLVTLFIGTAGADARRDLVLFGFSFQPFEILKIGLIMIMAKQLAKRQKNIENTPVMVSFRPSDWRGDGLYAQLRIVARETVPLLGPLLITCLITFKAVGNSTTLIVAATCIIMLYIGRVRMSDIGKILLLGGILAGILFAAGFGRSDTGASRISKFEPDMITKHVRINSEGVEVYDNPQEAGQATNAKMSIASGRFFGKGPGMSTHRSNLEEAEKDFAYAFIIEEYGAVGGLLIMLLYLWLFFRTITIFRNCGTAFPSLLVLGLGLMIVFQAMIHMLVSVGLFPITGQQLPLISRGGSSLVFTLTALGMILGVSRQTANRTLDAPKDESLFEKN